MATRRRGPVRALATYDPHPHQKVFHQDTHKYRALVSGVGAGKTRMGVEEVIKWTQLFPGSLGVIGRLTSKSLKETTQRRFFEVCDPRLIDSFNQAEGHLWIKTNAVDDNGEPIFSEILFMHLDEPGPLGSLDISYFWIDEAHEPDGSEVPEATFDMLTARLRHPIGPWRGFITSNSGGKDWVWKKFFNPDPRVRNALREYIGWVVPTLANEKYLPPGYVEELTRTHTQTWVDRFLNASFDSFEGQIFTDFEPDLHTYRDGEIEISPHWEHGGGFDFGVAAPTCCLYGAIDRDERIYIYDEDYEAEANIEGFANKILKKGFSYVSADPSVVNRGPGKKSPKQLYQEAGVNLIPAPNDEDFFISFLTQLLRARMPDGSPKIMFNRDKCPHVIDQIKQAAWDPTSLGGSTHDKVKKDENHARDALKYFINGYAFKPGLMNPVVPGQKETHGLKVNGQWEHESYLEDEDFDKDDYCHPEIKEAVENVS